MADNVKSYITYIRLGLSFFKNKKRIKNVLNYSVPDPMQDV